MSSRTLAGAGIVALFALSLAWQLALAPPQRMPPWIAALLHALPLVPAVVLLARRQSSAGFWGALAALILFCHGVSEAWSSSATRGLAFIEIALSVLVIFAASWNGLRARLAKRSQGAGIPPARG